MKIKLVSSSAMYVITLITVSLSAAAYAEPDYRQMRITTESAVRARMVDPSSSQFEWPHGFVTGEWKRLFSKRVQGWITCGYVNSRNRMGGYVGRTAFAVVLDDSAAIKLLDIGDASSNFDLVGMGCQKSAASFPSPQQGMMDDSSNAGSVAPTGSSVADEIAKLGALRDKGLITEAEFQTQKAKAMAR